MKTERYCFHCGQTERQIREANRRAGKRLKCPNPAVFAWAGYHRWTTRPVETV